jgi:hypothetical protein
MLVVSAQRGKWVGGVERQRDGSTSACLFGGALATGSGGGGLLQWRSFRSGYGNAIDQVDWRQADARASCTGLSEPFHTSRCCGNKVVTRRV